MLWVIAKDPALTQVVAQGVTVTDGDVDYTVKVDVEDLKPGQTYYYRFRALGHDSPVGRTRTLPKKKVDRLRLAFASCSNYPYGFFNAYGCIAARAHLDAVLHLGDYLSKSNEAGTRWRLIGQQVMFGQLVNALAPGACVFNVDQWDGYAASRARVLKKLDECGIGNVVVLTGDIHSSWGMDIADNPFNPASYNATTGAGSVAVEFVTPGVTSPGIEDPHKLRASPRSSRRLTLTSSSSS